MRTATRWSIVGLLAMLLAIPTALLPPSGGEAAPGPGPWLDLAWVVPSPAEAPQPGYGIITGSMYESLEAAGIRYLGATDAAEFGIASRGFVQSYFARIAIPNDEDPDFYAQSVNTRVTQFRDAESARTGWTVQRNFLEHEGARVLSVAPDLGEAAVAFRLDGASGTSRFQSVGVLVLATPLVVTLQLLDYTGDAPLLSAVEGIAPPVLERAAAVLDRPAPGPSRRIPRYGIVSREEYRRRGGEDLPLYLASPADTARGDEWGDRRGIDSTYSLASTVREPGRPAAAWNVTIWSLQSEALAQAFAEELVGDWLDSPPSGVSEVMPVSLAGPEDARTIVSYAWRPPGSDAIKRGYRAWFSVGPVVGMTDSLAVPGIRFAAFDTASTQAMSCLGPSGCPRQLAAASDFGAKTSDEARPPAPVVVEMPDAVEPPAAAAPLLDLAWIAPRPGDVPGSGYAAIRKSGWATEDAQFAWMVEGNPQASALFAAGTIRVGWRQGWSGSRATPLPDDPDWFARRLHVDLAQTGSAEGAADLAQALSLFALPAIGMASVDPVPNSIPGAMHFRHHGTLSDSTTVNVAAMVIQDGDVVLFFTLADFTGDVPAFSELLPLVEPAVERLARARAGEASGLAMHVPRYGWPEMTEANADYLLVDGEVQPRYGMSAEDVATVRQGLAGMGVVEALPASMLLPASEATDAELGLWHTISRFEAVASADAFIDDQIEEVVSGDSPGIRSIERSTDLVAGDRAVLVTYLLTDGPNRPYWQAADVWVRVGAVVDRVGITAPAALPRGDLEALALRAAECLQPAGCTEVHPLPPSLLADPDPVFINPGGALQPVA